MPKTKLITSDMVESWGHKGALDRSYQIPEDGICPVCHEIGEQDGTDWYNASIGFRKMPDSKYAGLIVIECPKCSSKIWQFIYDSVLPVWASSKAWKGEVTKT